MNRNKLLYRITKAIVDIMFYGGILCTLAVPFVLPDLIKTIGYKAEMLIPHTIILMLSGALAVYILFLLRQMFKTVIKGKPFVKKNISCLARCGLSAMLISAIFVVKVILWPTITAVIIAVTFALLGIFCLTLRDVFECAVAYKEENDFTI